MQERGKTTYPLGLEREIQSSKRECQTYAAFAGVLTSIAIGLICTGVLREGAGLDGPFVYLGVVSLAVGWFPTMGFMWAWEDYDALRSRRRNQP